jgi:hypothetical protein
VREVTDGAGGYRSVHNYEAGYRRVQEDAVACARVHAGARWCRRTQQGAGGHRSVKCHYDGPQNTTHLDASDRMLDQGGNT